MTNRDSGRTAGRGARGPVAWWIALGRGWQAVLFGVGIVLACHLIA